MRKVVDFILYSNLFISCCAVLMSLATFVLLGIEFSFQSAFPLIPLIFLSTLFVYNLDLFGLTTGLPQEGFTDRQSWRVRNVKKIKIFNLILAIAIGLLSLFSSLKSFLFFLHLAIISIAYYLSFKIGSARFASLRSIPFLKAFVITYVWTASTVLLPALKNDISFFKTEDVFMVFMERYFFLFALAIVFDIRDMNYDNKKIKTIPGTIGPSGTKYISYALLSLNILLACIHFRDLSILIALLISILATAYIIFRANPLSSEYYFLGILDGAMAIQSLAVMIAFRLYLF
jgi:hypothetical protein